MIPRQELKETGEGGETGHRWAKTTTQILLLSSHLVGGSAAVIWTETGCSYGDQRSHDL